MSNTIKYLEGLERDSEAIYKKTYEIEAEMIKNNGQLSASSAEKLLFAVQDIAAIQSDLAQVLIEIQREREKISTPE